MNNDEKKQKKLWMYAMVLFACAFIVILVTGYSQIKLKNKYYDYSKKASSVEKKNASFEQNLNSANKKIVELEKQIETEKLNNSVLSDKVVEYMEAVNSYNAVIKANDIYKNNNYIDCALTLKKKSNKKLLSGEGLVLYNFLANNTFARASESLYYKGYNYYVNRQYGNAIKTLENSLLIKGKEYYSDDCYYFISESYFALGNKEKARISAKNLIKKFPESYFVADAKSILKKIK